MPEESIKQKSMRGVIWSFTNTTSIHLVQFAVSMVLARLLSPEDYGVVGLAYVAIALVECFTNLGIGGAIIQKKDVDELDYNTYFWTDSFMRVLVYAIAFIIAPYVALYYDKPILTSIIRVVAINTLLSIPVSVCSIKLTRKLDFKTPAVVGFISAVISCVLALLLAWRGYGVWALVWQNFAATAVGIPLMIMIVPWRPCFQYSWARFREMFGFGSKMMASGILNTCYDNLNSMIIGKFFSIADLGYYTKGAHVPKLITSTVDKPINSVSFPMLSKLQNDPEKYRVALRKALKTSVFCIAPMMAGIFIIAEPMTVLLFGEKWLSSVFFVRVSAIIFVLYPIATLNLSAIKGLGRSDIFFWLEIAKKVMGLSIMLVAIPWGLKVFIISKILSSFLSIFINTFPLKKLINYSTWQQLKDIFGMLIGSIVMIAILYPLNYLPLNKYIIMAMQIPLGSVIYAVYSLIFTRELLGENIMLLKNIILKRK